MNMIQVCNTCLLFLLFIVYPIGAGWAQDGLTLLESEVDLKFEHLTREDGLPSNSIRSIFQDSRGFMWFGTEDGLVRYDCYELKVYKNDPNDQQSISDNRINTIYEDRAGLLWIGTSIGLNSYDRRTETFKTYLSSTQDSLNLIDNFINSIFEDQQGLFWIGTQSGGLNLMDRAKETFVHYLPDPDNNYGFVSNSITAIVDDATSPEILWLGTIMNKDLHVQFNTSNKTFLFFPKLVEERQQGPHGQINTILKSRTDKIWLGTAAGLDLFMPEKELFRNYNHHPDDSSSLSHNYVTAIFEDPKQTLWVGTFRGGLNKFDQASHSFQHYRHRPNDPQSLSSDRVFTIFEDRSGILWIGTMDAGISYVDRKKQKFKTVRPNINQQGNFTSRYAVSAIYQDRANVLWVGTPYNGLLYFDEKTNEFRHFQDESGALNILSRLWVWSIFEDRQGILWIGTNRDGLYRFDREKGTVKIYKNDPKDPNSLANDYIPSIHESRDGRLWIATYNGLQQLDRETESFQTINLIEEGARRKLISYLYEDHAGNLWVGSSSGLFCLNPETEIIWHFYYDQEDANSLSSNIINVVTEDTVHHIWIGTDKGLNTISFLHKGDFASNKPIIKRYTEMNGLASNRIVGIVEDDQGKLWISTFNGLSLFRNPQHDEQSAPDFKNYQ